MDDRTNELMGRLLNDKELGRQELARLPIEEKLRLIALMQRRANAIRLSAGRPTQPEWPLEELGFPETSEHKEVKAQFDELEGRLLTASPGVAAVMNACGAYVHAMEQAEQYLKSFHPTPVFTAGAGTAMDSDQV